MDNLLICSLFISRKNNIKSSVKFTYFEQSNLMNGYMKIIGETEKSYKIILYSDKDTLFLYQKAGKYSKKINIFHIDKKQFSKTLVDFSNNIKTHTNLGRVKTFQLLNSMKSVRSSRKYSRKLSSGKSNYMPKLNDVIKFNIKKINGNPPEEDQINHIIFYNLELIPIKTRIFFVSAHSYQCQVKHLRSSKKSKRNLYPFGTIDLSKYNENINVMLTNKMGDIQKAVFFYGLYDYLLDTNFYTKFINAIYKADFEELDKLISKEFKYDIKKKPIHLKTNFKKYPTLKGNPSSDFMLTFIPSQQEININNYYIQTNKEVHFSLVSGGIYELDEYNDSIPNSKKYTFLDKKNYSKTYINPILSEPEITKIYLNIDKDGKYSKKTEEVMGIYNYKLYQKIISKSSNNTQLLFSEVIDTIYENANLKIDENIIIVNDFCRAIIGLDLNTRPYKLKTMRNSRLLNTYRLNSS